MPGAQSGFVPVIRMYGITEEGNSVMAHVHGFAPYFFAMAPEGFRTTDVGAFRDALNGEILKETKANRESGGQAAVLDVRCVRSQSETLKELLNTTDLPLLGQAINETPSFIGTKLGTRTKFQNPRAAGSQSD